jgi:hypothetical protein
VGVWLDYSGVFGAITGFEEKVGEVCFHAEIKNFCRCQVNFSLETGNEYTSALFLDDDHMFSQQRVAQ